MSRENIERLKESLDRMKKADEMHEKYYKMYGDSFDMAISFAESAIEEQYLHDKKIDEAKVVERVIEKLNILGPDHGIEKPAIAAKATDFSKNVLKMITGIKDVTKKLTMKDADGIYNIVKEDERVFEALKDAGLDKGLEAEISKRMRSKSVEKVDRLLAALKDDPAKLANAITAATEKIQNKIGMLKQMGLDMKSIEGQVKIARSKIDEALSSKEGISAMYNFDKGTIQGKDEIVRKVFEYISQHKGEIMKKVDNTLLSDIKQNIDGTEIQSNVKDEPEVEPASGPKL